MIYLMLLAHLLYDFHWQGSFIAENKGKRPFLLLVHVTTWTMLVSLPLIYLGKLHPPSVLYTFIGLLFLSHLASDNWKSQLPKTDEYFWAIYVDQAVHFGSIFVIGYIAGLG